VAAADHDHLSRIGGFVTSKKDSSAAGKPVAASTARLESRLHARRLPAGQGGSPMDYRRLGSSGLKVSPLCLGTMLFGGATEEAEAARIVGAARDAGVNVIDTANVYTDGRSEQITGRLVRKARDWWVVATKIANPTGKGPNESGLSRRHCFDAVDASLGRLGIEAIDILYLHREDHATPLAETVRAIADLIGQGKVLHFAVSNHRAWRIAEICRLCDEVGIDRPIASQPLYNLLNRQVEVEHLPACAHFGLGVVPYSPLARGVLTAKYATQDAPPPDSRAGRADKRMMETEFRPESLRAAQAIRAYAESRGVTAGQFALAWVLNNRLVTGAVVGPRTLEQWRENLAALDCRITAEDEAFVDELVAPGHPSTPGYNDPAYPLEGRVPRS
jgi:aryl-alcohol dehydrogenase (NADP+)